MPYRSGVIFLNFKKTPEFTTEGRCILHPWSIPHPVIYFVWAPNVITGGVAQTGVHTRVHLLLSPTPYFAGEPWRGGCTSPPARGAGVSPLVGRPVHMELFRVRIKPRRVARKFLVYQSYFIPGSRLRVAAVVGSPAGTTL